MKRPRILLADDHRILTEALALNLREQFDVAGTFSNGRELLDALEREQVDAVVLDISMPEMNGLEAARRISARYPDLAIIFLTMHVERAYVEEAFRAGATAYVLKRQAASDLIQAIRSAVGRVRYISAAVWQPPPPGAEAARTVLSPRQREVLQLVAEGKSGKEIASILHISVKTVEFHKSALMDRLGMRTIAELTRYALEHLHAGS